MPKHQEKNNISEGGHINHYDIIIIEDILKHHDLININIVNNNNNTVLHEAVLAENLYAFCEIVHKFTDRINWGLINNNNEPLYKLILAKDKKYADIAGIGNGNNVELIEDQPSFPVIAIQNFAADIASQSIISLSESSKKAEVITANDRAKSSSSSIDGIYCYPTTQEEIQSSSIISFDGKEENLQSQNIESLQGHEVIKTAPKLFQIPAEQSSDLSQNLPPQTTKTTCFNRILKFFKPKCFANIHQ